MYSHRESDERRSSRGKRHNRQLSGRKSIRLINSEVDIIEALVEEARKPFRKGSDSNVQGEDSHGQEMNFGTEDEIYFMVSDSWIRFDVYLSMPPVRENV